MEFIRQWLEQSLGAPSWMVDVIVLPVLSIIIIIACRWLFLAITLRKAENVTKRRWKKGTFYATLFLCIAVVAGFWLTGATPLARILGPMVGYDLARAERGLEGAVYLLLLTFALVFLIYIIQRGYLAILRKLDEWAVKEGGIKFQKKVFLTPDRVHSVTVGILWTIRIVLFLGLIYFYIPLALSCSQRTQHLAGKIMPVLFKPLFTVWSHFVSYLPKLITLIIIIAAAHYLIKLASILSKALSNKDISLKGFDPEWAEPTFKLLRIFLVLVALMVCYPFLPGAGSEVFKGFSIFIGALVTLGSTSIIANVISGIVLTYTRSFKVGDRVRVGKTEGDIVEKRLFVTSVRTRKNEVVTVPNSVILGDHIINYSAHAEDKGLILTVTVSIGYDTDRCVVEKLLIDAALKTSFVVAEPAAFVYVDDLSDHYVVYMLNAYTRESHRRAVVLSELRKNILDIFHEARVEIMSPVIEAASAAHRPMIPEKYKP